jgi:ribonuclease Z
LNLNGLEPHFPGVEQSRAKSAGESRYNVTPKIIVNFRAVIDFSSPEHFFPSQQSFMTQWSFVSVASGICSQRLVEKGKLAQTVVTRNSWAPFNRVWVFKHFHVSVRTRPRLTFESETLKLQSSSLRTTTSKNPPTSFERKADRIFVRSVRLRNQHRESLECKVIYNSFSPKPIIESSDTVPNSLPRFTKMKSQATFITTPTADSAGICILLHFPDKRYMIGNLHEGVQRACTQNGVKLNKITDIFLTGKTEWKTIGGLLGMILTVADVTKTATAALKAQAKLSQARWEERRSQAKTPQALAKFEQEKQPKDKVIETSTLNIHGGDNLAQTIATARRFIFRKGMPIYAHEYAKSPIPTNLISPTWQDENIQVLAMPISPASISPSQGKSAELETSPGTRKRLLADFLELESANAAENPKTSLNLDEESQRVQMLKGVVSDMFNSDWRLDALFETPLRDVQMPAVIFRRDPTTKNIELYTGPKPGDSEELPDITVLVRKPWPGALITKLPSTSPSPVSMSYIIRNHPQRGKFNTKAAIALGVEPGALFSELAAGRPVQNKCGETILPEQVLAETKAGGGFAVVELPTKDYIPGLINRPEWKNEGVMQGIVVVIWQLGPGVLDDERLQHFISELSSVKHIISGPDYCSNNLTMDSSSAMTIRHTLIDPDRYSFPIHENRVKPLPASLSHCRVATRGLTISLQPTIKIEEPATNSLLNTTKVIKEMDRSVLTIAQSAQQQTLSTKELPEYKEQDLPSPNTEIITLGTGSAVPSKYRNVSSTLIRIPGIGSYLLDCGENTLGQLSRLYSEEELQEVLQDLKMIWISHMHADHHLGLTSVIKAWYTTVYGESGQSSMSKESLQEAISDLAEDKAPERRLFVASEPAMATWLREYAEIEDYGYSKISPLVISPGGAKETTKIWLHGTQVQLGGPETDSTNELKRATGLSKLEAVHVKHCSGAMAVALTFPTGFKVSYSGDCRPSSQFADIGADSTVLIHESTFDDTLSGDAKAKNHSTTSEAIGVGIKMRAKRIILTHFSQRYQKLPKMEQILDHQVVFDDSTTQNLDPIAGLEDDSVTEMTDIPTDSTTSENYNSTTDASLLAANESTREPSDAPAQLSSVQIQETKVAVAYDFMRVKVKDIMLLDKFAPAFVKLYDETPSK